MIHSVRMLSTPQARKVVIGGRNYIPGPGMAIDVASPDNVALSGNGWLFVCPSGPRETRPRTTEASQTCKILVRQGFVFEALGASEQPGDYLAMPGSPFYDTTLKQMIFWDGATWRDANGREA